MFLIPKKKRGNGYFRRLTLLKKLFWLYFFLLILEGALRKWVAPQFTGPLLIVRDPVALWIVWEAYRTHKWPARWSSLISALTVGVVALFVVQIVAGGNSWLVELYGLRSYLLPFPVAFIMAENLDGEDLRKLAAWTLILLLPNAVLAAVQFVSPATSFINAGAGAGGRQLDYVNGGVRASGTFSFVLGLTEFCTLAAAFIFHGMAKPGFVKTWLLWAGASALVFTIPMTGERTLVYEIILVLGCVGLSALFGISQFVRALRILVPLIILTVMVSFLPVFSQAMAHMTERFTGANQMEGGAETSVYERIIEPMIEEIETEATSSNWIGVGMGRGAIAVQTLFGTGGIDFGEGEAAREILEMGAIAGLGFVLFKILLAIKVFGMALARAREQEPLALLLVPLALNALVLGVPEQPPEQGFIVIGLAFCIAAARIPAPAVQSLRPSTLQRQHAAYPRRVAIRGKN